MLGNMEQVSDNGEKGMRLVTTLIVGHILTCSFSILQETILVDRSLMEWPFASSFCWAGVILETDVVCHTGVSASASCPPSDLYPISCKTQVHKVEVLPSILFQSPGFAHKHKCSVRR